MSKNVIISLWILKHLYMDKVLSVMYFPLIRFFKDVASLLAGFVLFLFLFLSRILPSSCLFPCTPEPMNTYDIVWIKDLCLCKQNEIVLDYLCGLLIQWQLSLCKKGRMMFKPHMRAGIVKAVGEAWALHPRSSMPGFSARAKTASFRIFRGNMAYVIFYCRTSDSRIVKVNFCFIRIINFVVIFCGITEKLIVWT